MKQKKLEKRKKYIEEKEAKLKVEEKILYKNKTESVPPMFLPKSLKKRLFMMMRILKLKSKAVFIAPLWYPQLHQRDQNFPS